MSNGIQEVDQEVLGTIKRHAGFGMAAGIAIAIAVGVLLIASGVSRLFLAFRLGSFGVGLLVFVLGVLSIVIGGYMVSRPGMALATLTLVLALYFFVHGVFEII